LLHKRLKVARRELSPVEVQPAPQLDDFSFARIRGSAYAAARPAVAYGQPDVDARALDLDGRANGNAVPLTGVLLLGDPAGSDLVVDPVNSPEGHRNREQPKLPEFAGRCVLAAVGKPYFSRRTPLKGFLSLLTSMI